MTEMSQKNTQQHKPDLPSHIFVSTPAVWQDCLEKLQQEPRIAMDLEANSMYVYQEEICLIQISIPGQDYILDPTVHLDLSGLGDLVTDPAVEKVFHAAEYDLLLMKQQFDWELENLFDTMWAARILGYHRIGLASILSKLYGLKLDKRYQRANWCRRPLSDEQLAYAQADTHYLLRLRERFAEALKEGGHWEEAQEIFGEQSHVEVTPNEFDPDSFWSINGANRLPPQGKAVLKALNIYRNDEARERDRPPFKVLPNKTLLELARYRPGSQQALSRIHGMSSGQMRRYGRDVLQIIRENRDAPAPRRPRRPRRPPEDVYNRYEKLRTWRKERGVARGVESDVIMPKDTLWELAHANPQSESELEQIESLGPWRRRTYGKDIIKLLNGQQ